MKRGPKPGRRWPFEPLYAWLDARHVNPTRKADASTGGALSLVFVGTLCGKHRVEIHRWKREGLTTRAADEAAIRVGTHPALIWPDWLDDEAAA